MHTPGPWIANEHGEVRLDVKGYRPFVANAAIESRWHATEIAANARLIAAAPDLLAALQAMVDNYIDAYGDEGDDAPVSVKAARAAIAKAGQ